jgi:hypothetical protein
MTFHLVDSVEEVLDLALEDALPPRGPNQGRAAGIEKLVNCLCQKVETAAGSGSRFRFEE